MKEDGETLKDELANLPKPSKFAYNLEDFKLNSPISSPSLSGSGAPSSSASSMETAATSASLWEFPVLYSGASPATTPRTRTGFGTGRRQSTLASQVYMPDDMGMDMEDVAVASDEDEEPGLASPFMSHYDEPSSNPKPPLQASRMWPRSASFANISDRSVMVDQLPKPVSNDKSFNPLNPTGSAEKSVSMDTDQPTTRPLFSDQSFASPLRNSVAPKLVRARSSPSLRRMVEDAALTIRTTDDPVDINAASFEGLGVSLPNSSHIGDLPSPPSRGPQRRVVSRRGNLFVSQYATLY